MDVTFRKAAAADIDAVEAIYDAVHEAERVGTMQIGWVKDLYPVRRDAEEALARDDLYVCEEAGELLACGIINHVQPEAYAQGDWAYPAEENEVLILHTLAVRPSRTRQGIGKAFLAFYHNLARKSGCKVLRLDTAKQNKAAQTLYTSLGYRRAGVIPCRFAGRIEMDLVLLEKTVD